MHEEPIVGCCFSFTVNVIFLKKFPRCELGLEAIIEKPWVRPRGLVVVGEPSSLKLNIKETYRCNPFFLIQRERK